MKHLGVLPAAWLAALAVATVTTVAPASAADTTAKPAAEAIGIEGPALPVTHPAYVRLQEILADDSLPAPARRVLERVVAEGEQRAAPGWACRRIAAAGETVDQSLVQRCREHFGDDANPWRVCRRVAQDPAAVPSEIVQRCRAALADLAGEHPGLACRYLTIDPAAYAEVAERCREYLAEHDGAMAWAVCRRLLASESAEVYPDLLERCRASTVNSESPRVPMACDRIAATDRNLERCRAWAADVRPSAQDDRMRDDLRSQRRDRILPDVVDDLARDSDHVSRGDR
ncbi:MAG: hypothetical protein GEU80_08750 [Dehalococcoidia bacterium]|nr:hypothetical protein [Dehalococcoidia bacterium]